MYRRAITLNYYKNSPKKSSHVIEWSESPFAPSIFLHFVRNANLTFSIRASNKNTKSFYFYVTKHNWLHFLFVDKQKYIASDTLAAAGQRDARPHAQRLTREWRKIKFVRFGVAPRRTSIPRAVQASVYLLLTQIKMHTIERLVSCNASI